MLKLNIDRNFAASMVLAAACWGLGGVMTKSVLANVPPLTLLVAQLVVSILFLWAIVLAQKLRLPQRRDVLRLGLTGLLNPGLAYTFSLLGLTLTTASMSALLWGAEPILILILAGLILREWLTPTLVGLAAVAMFGMVMILGLGGNSGSWLGNLLILAGVACCAYYTVLTRRLAADADPLLVIAVQQTFALIWALAIWPVELLRGETVAISPSTWLWAAISGLTYYAFAFWFYIVGLKQVPASTAGQFLNLIPIFGVAGAAIFLGERLGLAQWLGAILILAAVAGIVRGQQKTAAVAAS